MTDLTVTEQEQEFLKAFVTILHHLQQRAIKAEREVESLRKELSTFREKIEFDSIMVADASERPTCAT